ncbi:MAG: glycosyltransferase family 2 protein [Verrucomicrobium sp.]
MTEAAAMVIFAGLAFLFVYVHVGYPALMYFLAARFPRKSRPQESSLLPQRFSVLLCVHNEATRITARLNNLKSLTWPGTYEIIVVCDGCTDDTAAIARTAGPEIVVVESPDKQGKPAGLNQAVQKAAGDILILCDARQTFASDAIVELTKLFADPAVGAVSGALEIAGSAEGGGQGVDLYWKLEKKLREWEGKFSSVVGCTGAIYALRRQLYQPIPTDTLLDDVVIPMQAVMQGSRVSFAPTAVAFDPQHLDPNIEARRKLRTLVGNYQMLVRQPQWLLPGRCPICWQVISHKYLRLAVPWMMGVLLLVTAFLGRTHVIFALALAAQVACYGLGLIGLTMPGIRSKFLSVPAGFLVLQWANLKALFAWVASVKNPNSLWR